MIGVKMNMRTKANVNLFSAFSKYTKTNPLTETSSEKDGFHNYKEFKVNLEEGKTYTFQVKCDGVLFRHQTYGHDPSKKHFTAWVLGTDYQPATIISTDGVSFQSGQWYANTFRCKQTGLYFFRTNLYSDGETAYTVHFWDIKLEEGDTPTDVN